jgi:hypothetical protein
MFTCATAALAGGLAVFVLLRKAARTHVSLGGY